MYTYPLFSHQTRYTCVCLKQDFYCILNSITQTVSQSSQTPKKRKRKEVDSIWNERSRVIILISWDNLRRNRPKIIKFELICVLFPQEYDHPISLTLAEGCESSHISHACFPPSMNS